jgi:ferredoxin
MPTDFVGETVAYRIKIDVEECMSSGKCVADYPSAFDFDDEELSTLTDSSTLSDQDMVRAARNCPSRALSVYDVDGSIVPT